MKKVITVELLLAILLIITACGRSKEIKNGQSEMELKEFVADNYIQEPSDHTDDSDEIDQDSPEQEDPDKNTREAEERSKGSKYKSFLEQYEGNVQKACERLPGEYGDKTEIHYFYITDLNSDVVEDLITLEIVNGRYEKIGIYTLDESEAVVPFYFEDGSEALFDDNHQANGSYNFYICSNRHVHNNFGGGLQTIEDTYIVDGRTLKHHIRYNDFHDYSMGTDHKETISKDGNEISRGEYDSLIENCSSERFSWTLNDEEGRDTIK